MKIRSLVLTAALLVVALAIAVAAGCGGSSGGDPSASSSPASGGTIKIGALLDFTGPVADLGPMFEQGIKLALEEANYTVAGKNIELIVEDTATSVDTAVVKAKKLVEQDGVKIIIGPLMGDAHLALGPYTASKKVLITSLINGMPEVAGKGNYLIYPTTVQAQTYPFGQYCYDELGYKTAVVVAADYAGKRGYADGWMKGFKDAGGTIVQEIYTPVGTPDFSAFIGKIKDADVVLYALEGPGAVGKFIYQYRQSGKSAPLVTITQDGDYSPQMLNELKGLVVGIKGESSYTWKLDNAANGPFVDGIRNVWDGNPPMSEQQNAYTLTKAILAGLEATGGDDSLDKLYPAITSMTMETPAGSLSWQANGVAITPWYVTTAEKVGDQYEISAPLFTGDPIVSSDLPL